jgi:SAM-dependent methyltransferase
MQENTNPWDNLFQNEGKVFVEPHEDLPGIVKALKDVNAKRVLDLGSGSGRHVIYLAKHGFLVYGLDSSPEGVALTNEWLSTENLSASIQLGSMHDALPYDDAFFDGVISVQVIHHAKIAAIRKIVDEITRVLKPEGLLFLTVPKVNYHREYIEIEPATIVPLSGPEKGLPHHYFTPEELREVFEDFEIMDVHIDRVDHYCLLASKR